MAGFVGSNWFLKQVWKCVGGVWSEVLPRPEQSTSRRAVYQTYDGTKLWRGKDSDEYQALTGGSWNFYSVPNAGNSFHDMCESIDGSRLYAIEEANGRIYRYINGVWSSVSPPGYIGGSYIWCDLTGQYVYITYRNAEYLWFSDDYGATWSNLYSQIATSPTDLNGVWGFGSGASHQVFVCTDSGTIARLHTRSSLGSWSIVVSTTTYNINFPSLWGLSPDNLFLVASEDGAIGPGSAYYPRILRWNGSTLDLVHAGTVGKENDWVGRKLIGDENEILAVFTRDYTLYPGVTWRSTDGGDTWVEVDMSPMGGNQYITNIALYDVHYPPTPAPYLHNQDPAPSSSGNSEDTQIYLEIIDDDENIDTSTVEIYVDGSLAWTNEAPVQPGWFAIKVPVSLGYGYTISPATELSDGSHSVRVVAEDTQGLTLDTTYSFSVSAPVLASPGSLVEEFLWEWRSPRQHRAVELSNTGRAAPIYVSPEDAFSVSKQYRDLDTGGLALAYNKPGAGFVYFYFVDWLNPVPRLLGFCRNDRDGGSSIDHIIAERNVASHVITEPDGLLKQFAATLSDTPVHAKITEMESTLDILVTIGSVQYHVTDDGEGALTCDSDILNSALPNTINYDTGALALAFNAAVDASTDIIVYYENGQVVTATAADTGSNLPYVAATSVMDERSPYSDELPPYNHSGANEFLQEDLQAIEVGGSEGTEDFETTWRAPRSGGAPYNEASQAAFTATDLTQATFAPAAKTYEDFEAEWGWEARNEESILAFTPSDIELGPTETFESGWNSITL